MLSKAFSSMREVEMWTDVKRLKAATIVTDKCKDIHILDRILPGMHVEIRVMRLVCS